MRKLNLKLNLNARGLMVLTAIAALSATTVLSGCGQRARLRLPAPPAENSGNKKITEEAGKIGKTKAPLDGLSGATSGTGVTGGTGSAEDLTRGPAKPATGNTSTPATSGTGSKPNTLATPAVPATPAAPIPAAKPGVLATTPAAPATATPATPAAAPAKPSAPAVAANIHSFGAIGASKLEELEVARKNLGAALADMANITHLGSIKVLPSTEDLVLAAMTASDVTILESDVAAYCTLFSAESNSKAPLDGNEKFCEKAPPLNAATLWSLELGESDNELCKGLVTVTRLIQGSHRAVEALRADLIKNPGFEEIDKLNSENRLEDHPEFNKRNGEVYYYTRTTTASAQIRVAAKTVIELAKSASCPL